MNSYISEAVQRIGTMHLADVLHPLGILLLGLLIPMAIYCGRNNLRQHRRKVVRDLAAMFDFAQDGGRPIIIPSLELLNINTILNLQLAPPSWIESSPAGGITRFRSGFMCCLRPSVFVSVSPE